MRRTGSAVPRRLRRRAVVITLLPILTLVVAACGSSSSSSSTSAAGNSPSSTSSAASSTSSSTSSSTFDGSGPFTANMTTAIKQAAAYTGSKVGKASSSAKPYVIGWINQEGGVPSFLPADGAMKAWVKFVNTDLGGLQGHPVELKTCYVVSSPQDAQTCAQKFAADSTINLVVLGDVTLGTASIYSTLEGRKPFISITPNTPADISQSVYYYFPGQGGDPLSIAFAKQYLHAKKMALVVEANAGAEGAAQQVAKSAKAAGVSATVASAATASDFNAALLSAGASSANAIFALVTAPNCAPVEQAVKQSGITTPVIGLQFCVDTSVIKANGGDLPKWDYYFSSDNPYDPASSPDVQTYRSVMSTFEPSSGYDDVVPFGAMMVATKMINQIGIKGATVSGIKAWQKAYHGKVFLGASKASCGTSASTPSLCAVYGTVGEYSGNGHWHTVSVSVAG
jgi:branched-chain amino acid transport system substrate-binding protein